MTLAACGGGGGGGEATGSMGGEAEAGGGGGSAVSVKSIGGAGMVLVDSSGQALYSSNLEANGGAIVCTGSCNSFWKPLTASGSAPSASSSVPGKLGVVKRPDGTRQVTYEGAPLYSFTQEGPGEASGDGFVDQFNGHQFTWSVAKVGGGSSESSGSESESETESGTSSSEGRYGY